MLAIMCIFAIVEHMADFELAIDTRRFQKLGVRCTFDENRYTALLELLTGDIDKDDIPELRISSEPLWNPTKLQELRYNATRDLEYFPVSWYDPSTATINLKVGADTNEANKLLLLATRRWAGDVNGEREAALARSHDRRYLTRTMLLAPTIGGAALAGSELHAGGIGYFIGGVFGATIGAAGMVLDKSRSPYDKAVRAFMHDPAILEEFGQIIGYAVKTDE